jgi:CO/xanthine dehydrogenase Mo-binding subunit/aerobic-type carbon monoxide dehydrogenase small subunit (CoxS/CutS family)
MDKEILIFVNGQEKKVVTNPQRPLLDVIREDMKLTGTNYGCREGLCGACTVLIEGEPNHSCMVKIGDIEGKWVTTIEGLADGDKLHPIQQAFIDEGAFQCGYCTPGMILNSVALLQKHPNPTDTEIIEWMDGNICRWLKIMSEKNLAQIIDEVSKIEDEESVFIPDNQIKIDRRTFVQLLGAGILVTITSDITDAQFRRGGMGGGRPIPVEARLHVDQDGIVTIMTGKVDEGQGCRTQLLQAAAEELRISPDKVKMILADTALVPDDGMTAGSRTTPQNVPPVRQAAATAREIMTQLAAEQWKVPQSSLQVQYGIITNPANNEQLTYGDIAKTQNLSEAFKQNVSSSIALTPVSKWKVLGTPVHKPTGRDIVTGAHLYPSDIRRPNMLYGKVLRAPSYGATLKSVDVSKAKEMKDVVVVQEGQFVGVAAPTTFLASQAIEAIAKTAVWETTSQPSSNEIYQYLREHSRSGQRNNARNTDSDGFSKASKVLKQTYHAAYIQHTPMEPRASVAEWNNGNLTTWAGIDYPQRIQGDLARAFNISNDKVRVIVPDMGGGFGGKHTGQAAEEAARLAKAAGRPVSIRWTRADEFTWAYFRPAAVIDCRGGLDENGSIIAWEFININSGNAALNTPYRIPDRNEQYISSDSPLSQGAYRCLAATANNFSRECFMDELAAAAGADPLEFRLKHLDNQRIRTVLEKAAKEFDWETKRKQNTPETGFGLACGTEKNSVVAACVEVGVNAKLGTIEVKRVCEAFECGPIQNPDNLLSQVQGCIIMGLGGALREEMKFKDGMILNADFSSYLVPRFKDVPKIDVHLINNTEIESAGAGETPIIAIAPAISNAVFAATGIRLRSMPMLPAMIEHATKLNETVT